MNIKKITFWGTTGLFGLAMGASGSAYLSQSPALLQAFEQLGYPVYLPTFLGIAKILGATALVYRRWSVLTEWAYAGFTFTLLGAAYSHGMSGDPIAKVIAPLLFLGLLAISYILSQAVARPENRTPLVHKPAPFQLPQQV